MAQATRCETIKVLAQKLLNSKNEDERLRLERQIQAQLKVLSYFSRLYQEALPIDQKIEETVPA